MGIVYASCTSDTKPETNVEDRTLAAKESSCYARISGKDSIFLSLNIKNDSVFGDLTYNFFEKDDNSGSIEGTLAKDIIFAAYIFNSEGTLSKREVVFIKVEDSYVEGFGEMKEQGGSMIFANRNEITFNAEYKLNPTDCSFDD